MSWFDTLKKVANAVGTAVIKLSPSPNIAVGAVSDNHPGYWNILSEASTSQQQETASAIATQVTTVSRFTYELDRFEKNAMILFVQNKSDTAVGEAEENVTTQVINALMDTFTGFRFEVCTEIDLTCSEINAKCQEFFQQDFRQYGAVVVAVLSFEGITGELSARDGRFSESIILRHLTHDLNPSLLAKPKIYVTMANRTVSSDNDPSLSLPFGNHQDVLGFHLPTNDYGPTARHPLLLLCQNINEMANTNDLVTIIKKSVEDIENDEDFGSENKPIEFKHSFTKEMLLAR